MAIRRQKLRLGDILVNQHVITQEELQEALDKQRNSGRKLGEVLVDIGIISDRAIASALQTQLGHDMVELSTVTIPMDIINLVSGAILRKHTVIPFAYDPVNPNVLKLAMADPMDMLAIDDISIITNMQIEAVITTPKDILLAIDKYYGDTEAMYVAEQYTKEREAMYQVDEDDELYNEDINNSPIVLLVKAMIEQAVRQRASDIHIEALDKKVRVRYRIDGVLYEKITYDVRLLPAIVARVKVISGMDISEKRKPQDGRITMIIDRREYDIRASVLPTVFGEKIVLRLASKMAFTKDKKELGFIGDEMLKFDRILKHPHGIILVTGPTGSGKSTTLYTSLSELNREDVNIITVEDPVEANVDGVNQVQVNPKAGLTFETALRSILRQDPDIIMIGEIRDKETASIAVQASVTGHLVVSTLHTNSVASTITRLSDMGVENYLLSDAIVGVIAQRLVRKLCDHCKRERPATETEKEFLRVDTQKDIMVNDPVGCSYCNSTGYLGRIGVYEIMEITPKVKQVIAKSADSDLIKEAAMKDGMQTLRASVTQYVINGTTSISEMIRTSVDE